MIVRAKYALIAPGEVRRDVRLEIGNSNILTVNSGFSPYALRADYDFGNAVITPGFVNPHCHLELEFCRDAVEYDGSFVDWLQHIRDLKAARKAGPTMNPRGSMLNMVETGCTTVLDHHTIDLDFRPLRASACATSRSRSSLNHPTRSQTAS